MFKIEALAGTALLLIAAAAHGATLYVDGDFNDIRNALPSLQGRDRDNALLIGSFPVAVWLTDGSPAEVEKKADAIVSAAALKNHVPVLVAYNLPFRDCQQYSSGGSADTAAYRRWIDGLASGIGKRRAIVIVEPDSIGIVPHYTNLAGIAEWCKPKEPGASADARFTELNYAADRLGKLPNARVYLDGTHSAWLPVGDTAHRLLRAGIAKTAGFFLNVSNYQPTDDLMRYGTSLSACIAGASRIDKAKREPFLKSCTNDVNASPVPGAPHFIIDTSRNGRGAWTAPAKYSDAQAWCNPPGRGIGERPTLTTSHSLLDAKLWIKVPGESDGQCTRGTPGSIDPERGMVDPPAGKWFKEQADELVRLAVPELKSN